MQVFVVRDAFAHYAVGAIIREPAEMQAVRDADQAHFCTPTSIDDSFFEASPEPVVEAEPAPAVEAVVEPPPPPAPPASKSKAAAAAPPADPPPADPTA